MRIATLAPPTPTRKPKKAPKKNSSFDDATQEWYQDFRKFIVILSNRRWKKLFPRFRAHSSGDKLEGYAIVKGICDVPKQYGLITRDSEFTPDLISRIGAKAFVVKDCIGNSSKQVLCIERFRDNQSGRTLYRDHLKPLEGTRTRRELVQHLKARFPGRHGLRILIEEFIPAFPGARPGASIPPDYKVYVVDGCVRAVNLYWRGPKGRFEAAFTRNWKRVPLENFYENYDPRLAGYHDFPNDGSIPFELPSAKVREQLLKTAKSLAKAHHALFCRYDFYICGDRIVLGEVTPVCGGLKNHPITRQALRRLYPPDVRRKYLPETSKIP